jgi:hypothetical protein
MSRLAANKLRLKTKRSTLHNQIKSKIGDYAYLAGPTYLQEHLDPLSGIGYSKLESYGY